MFSVAHFSEFGRGQAGFLPFPVCKVELFFPGNYLVCWKGGFSCSHSRLQILEQDEVVIHFAKPVSEVSLVPDLCGLVRLLWDENCAFWSRWGTPEPVLPPEAAVFNMLGPACCLLLGRTQVTKQLQEYL